MLAIQSQSLGRRLLVRSLAGAAVLLALVAGGLGIARAGEIVPSVGIVKPVDGDDTDIYGALAVRGNLLPILMAEVQAGYRQEERFDDRLKIRMWPVTGSLYFTPFPAVYAGGGVGWYHVTLDFDDDLTPPLEDETTQEFGVHVGGGLRVPIAPVANLDLSGRYVMMRDQEARLVPEDFDPDFWMTSIGIGFHW
jgi:hypothetical protein